MPNHQITQTLSPELLQQAIENNDSKTYEQFLNLGENEFNEILLQANAWASLLRCNGFHSVKFLDRVFKTLAPSQISHYILLSAPYDMEKFQECFNKYADKMDFLETAKFLISLDSSANLGKFLKIEKNTALFQNMFKNKSSNGQTNLWLYAIENYAFKCEHIIKSLGKNLR